MAIERTIQHGQREGFGSLASGGLNLDSFPMKLFKKGNKKFWDPADIDMTQDVKDVEAMTSEERALTCALASAFMAGEESVTQDLQPFLAAMAAEGRLADEAYLAQFLFEEAKHMEAFRLWFDAVGITEDLHSHIDKNEHYTQIFYHELPKALYGLGNDPSPAQQLRASATYNHIVEGSLALTGYHAWAKVCASRGILPGMQRIVKLIGDDERRHMAWGTFTCRRHVAADEANWSVVESHMQHLMQPALAFIGELFSQFGDPAPFGLDSTEMTEYAADKVTRRLESIQSACGKPVHEIDEDFSPMDLEDRFADEDEAKRQAAIASTS